MFVFLTALALTIAALAVRDARGARAETLRARVSARLSDVLADEVAR